MPDLAEKLKAIAAAHRAQEPTEQPVSGFIGKLQEIRNKFRDPETDEEAITIDKFLQFSKPQRDAFIALDKQPRLPMQQFKQLSPFMKSQYRKVGIAPRKFTTEEILQQLNVDKPKTFNEAVWKKLDKLILDFSIGAKNLAGQALKAPEKAIERVDEATVPARKALHNEVVRPLLNEILSGLGVNKRIPHYEQAKKNERDFIKKNDDTYRQALLDSGVSKDAIDNMTKSPASKIAEAGEKLVKDARFMSTVQQKFQRNIWDAAKDGNYTEAGENLMHSIATNLPQMLGVIFGGPAGLSIIGASKFSESAEQVEDREDLSGFQKLLVPTLKAGTEVLFEYAGTGKTGKMLREVLLNRGTREGLKAGIRRGTMSILARGLAAPTRESVEEIGTQISDNVIDILFNIPGPDGKIPGIFDNVPDSGIIGFAMGFGPGALQVGIDLDTDARTPKLVKRILAVKEANPNASNEEIVNKALEDYVTDAMTEVDRRAEAEAESEFKARSEARQDTGMEFDKIDQAISSVDPGGLSFDKTLEVRRRVLELSDEPDKAEILAQEFEQDEAGAAEYAAGLSTALDQAATEPIAEPVTETTELISETEPVTVSPHVDLKKINEDIRQGNPVSDEEYSSVLSGSPRDKNKSYFYDNGMWVSAEKVSPPPQHKGGTVSDSTLMDDSDMSILGYDYVSSDLRTEIGTDIFIQPVGMQDSLDIIFDKKADPEKAKGLYDSFSRTREHLRRKYGDTVTLYRAQGDTDAISNKNVLNFATEEMASKFLDEKGERRLIKEDVPIEDIVGVVVEGKNYHEFKVLNRNSDSAIDTLVEPVVEEIVETQDLSPVNTMHPDFRKTLEDSDINPEEKAMLLAPDVLRDPRGQDPDTGKPVKLQLYQGKGRASKESIYAPGAEGPVVGDGEYYAITEEDAKGFGPDVRAETVELQNPYVLTTHKQIEQETGLQLPLDNKGRVPVMRSFREALDRKGYDGIIVNVPKSSDTNADGELVKRLRELFDITQVVAFKKKAAPAKAKKKTKAAKKAEARIKDVKKKVEPKPKPKKVRPEPTPAPKETDMDLARMTLRDLRRTVKSQHPEIAFDMDMNKASARDLRRALINKKQQASSQPSYFHEEARAMDDPRRPLPGDKVTVKFQFKTKNSKPLYMNGVVSQRLSDGRYEVVMNSWGTKKARDKVEKLHPETLDRRRLSKEALDKYGDKPIVYVEPGNISLTEAEITKIEERERKTGETPEETKARQEISKGYNEFKRLAHYASPGKTIIDSRGNETKEGGVEGSVKFWAQELGLPDTNPETLAAAVPQMQEAVKNIEESLTDDNTLARKAVEKYEAADFDNITEAEKSALKKISPDLYNAFFPKQKMGDNTEEAGSIPIGDMIESAASAARRVRKWLKKWLTTDGNYPSWLVEEITRRDGAFLKEIKRANFHLADLRRAITKEYGKKSLEDPTVLQMINRALKRELTMVEIPIGLRAPIQALRDHVDALSSQLIKEGVVDDELSGIISNNLGMYLTRTYRVFKDPDWAEKVDARVKTRAAMWIRDNYEEQFAKEYAELTGRDQVVLEDEDGNLLGGTFVREDDTSITINVDGKDTKRSKRKWEITLNEYAEVFEEMDMPGSEANKYREDRVEGTIKNLLYKGKDSKSPMATIAASGLSKNLGILKKKQDIPEELRALWGEETDPTVSYIESVSKIAQLATMDKFMKDVARIGTDLGLFRTGGPKGDLSVRAIPVTQEPSGKSLKEGKIRQMRAKDAVSPLADLWTTEEMREVLDDMAPKKGDIPTWLSVWLTINGIVKWNKTVGSWKTNVRNYLANPLFLIASGHFNVLDVGRAMKDTSAMITKKGDVNTRKDILRLLELGVIDDNTWMRETQDIFRDAGIERFEDSKAYRRISALLGENLTSKARKYVRVRNELYQAQDNFWKITLYNMEYKELRKMGHDHKTAEEQAAAFVRDRMPTYSKIPQLVKSLRRFPVLGSFVSFPAEVVRTGKNNIMSVKKDMTDMRAKRGDWANPNINKSMLRKRLLRRITGLLLGMSGTEIVATISRLLSGVSDEEDEAIREMGPYYQRNSTFIYWGRSDDGQPRFADVSYLDPWAYLKKPIMALFRGASDNEIQRGIMEAGEEAAQPFLGGEILFNSIMETVHNRKPTGGDIYRPGDSITDVLVKSADHIIKILEPGDITSARRLYKGYTGEITNYGRKYELPIEIISELGGARIQQIDIPVAVGFRAGDYSREIAGASAEFKAEVSTQNSITDDEIKAAYKDLKADRRESIKRMYKVVRGARRSGMTDNDVYSVLLSSGVGSRAAGSLLENQLDPYIPPENLMDKYITTAGRRVGVAKATDEAIRRMAVIEAEAMNDATQFKQIIPDKSGQ